MADLRILSHWTPTTPFTCLFCDAQPMLATDTSFLRAHPVAVSCRSLSSLSPPGLGSHGQGRRLIRAPCINQSRAATPFSQSPLQGSSLSHRGHVTTGKAPWRTGGTARLGH